MGGEDCAAGCRTLHAGSARSLKQKFMKKKNAVESASPGTAKSGAVNMTKEYRRELREIRRRMAAVGRAQNLNFRETKRAVEKIEDAAVREIRALKKSAEKLDNFALKEVAALQKREAILAGRLS